MKLAQLIRKGGLVEVATATHATIATHELRKPPTVAPVAPVAVAAAIKPFDCESFDERAAIIETNGIPHAWAEGFATLCTMPCHSAYALQRWEQLVNDGGLFLDRWGRQAAVLGWRAIDVFGVNPDAPERRYDSMGLVPLLQGRPIVAITADTARIDCGNGAYLTFYRMMAVTGSVALWEMEWQT